MSRRSTRTRLLQVTGGLLVAATIIALPTLLGFAATESLAASYCIGDPSAAALRSLGQSLQGGSVEPAHYLFAALPDFAGSTPRRTGLAPPAPSDRIRSTSIDEHTVLRL